MSVEFGRFWSMDVFEGFKTDPDTLHKYLYGNADPIGNLDPSGRFSLKEINITQAIVNFALPTYSLRTFAVRAVVGSALSIAQTIWMYNHVVPMIIEVENLASVLAAHGNNRQSVEVRKSAKALNEFYNSKLNELALNGVFYSQLGFAFFSFRVSKSAADVMERISEVKENVANQSGLNVDFEIDWMKTVGTYLSGNAMPEMAVMNVASAVQDYYDGDRLGTAFHILQVENEMSKYGRASVVPDFNRLLKKE